jgi:hypothetical protein
MTDGAATKSARKDSRVLQTGLVASAAYVTAVLVNLVTEDSQRGAKFWILASGGLVVSLVLTRIVAWFEDLSRESQEKLDREYRTHRSGYQTLSREISQYIALARRYNPNDPGIGQAPVELMRNACRDLYDTLETEYGHAVGISEHIEFEVTFMTTSLNDGEITIAAWANRDARAPKSLASRKSNSTFYAGTETHMLYQDHNRTPRFVSTTDTQSYKELYTGQKTRIKSSVIWPVVDDEFALRGTLVVHCDREGFFSNASEKLWREALEPYTKRLALARVLADRAQGSGFGPAF